jgi:hypothetical protein
MAIEIRSTQLTIFVEVLIPQLYFAAQIAAGLARVRRYMGPVSCETSYGDGLTKIAPPGRLQDGATEQGL